MPRFAALLLVLIFSLAGPIAARADIPPPSIAARAWVLIEVTSGMTIASTLPDERVEPASLTKLMTAYLTFAALRDKKISLNQTIPVSERAWRAQGSRMFIDLKKPVTAEELIHGMIIQSGNDACIALAEAIAGSEETFAQLMTKEALRLGMKNTSFTNSSGLPDPKHYSTARDLGILATAIVRDFPEQYRYYSIREYRYNNITQQNRNPLLKDYPGADGMKTGYTKEAGYGLIGSAQRDGRRLVMVIAGLKTINERRQEAQGLLDWGFKQFRTVDVYAKGDRVGQARVWGGTERHVALLAAGDVRVALTPQEKEMAEVKLAYTGPLIAPVEAGQQVGSVRFIVDGVTVADVPVVAAGAIAEEPSMWSRAVDSVFIMVFGS